MKVDVVIETIGAVIENTTVHVSKEIAERQIKKWFSEHYPSSKNYSKGFHYDQWKKGEFEFDVMDECHEIFHVEDLDMIGPDGADLCKHCRERT